MCDDSCASATMAAQEKSKFLAAQSTGNCASLSQSFGNGAYDCITACVAVPIVDRLEPVDIEQ